MCHLPVVEHSVVFHWLHDRVEQFAQLIAHGLAETFRPGRETSDENRRDEEAMAVEKTKTS